MGRPHIWSNGLTASTITVTPNITTYVVTVSNANNCTSTTSHSVMVKPKPEVNVAGPDRICNGSSTFIVVNGQSTNECPGVCDVDQPTVLVFWDLEACHSVMNLGTHMDYSEFVPVINKQNCTNVTAGNVHRLNQYKHSCTPGHDGNIGMCIGTQRYCNPSKLDYGQALRFEVTINPGQTGQITGLSFYEQSPLNYQFVNGASGLNDYATKYLIRVSKGGKYIFYRDEIATNRSWGLEQFDFSNNPLFKSNAAATYLFELIPYCPINNGANESIWDIDDIKVLGGCCNSNTPEVMTYLWSNDKLLRLLLSIHSNTTYTVTDRLLWLYQC
ncbi:MAG: hypothetical protein U0T36_00065 [Saprospiraceae bacterium]